MPRIYSTGRLRSNLVAPIIANEPGCTNGGFIPITFDFRDPDGDVLPSGPVNVTFEFSDGATTPNLQSGRAAIGAFDGFEGTLRTLWCWAFGAARTSVTTTVWITDDAGNVSNSVSVTANKPAGVP